MHRTAMPKVPGSIVGSVFLFCFVVVALLLFWGPKPFVLKFCNSLCNVIPCSIHVLNILQKVCDQLYPYTDIDSSNDSSNLISDKVETVGNEDHVHHVGIGFCDEVIPTDDIWQVNI